MYESHFGFHRQPFQSAESARSFLVSESIRSILPQLLHALRSDLGIAVLTGPAGVGKTSLLKHIRSLLANEGRTLICSGASLETPSNVIAALATASLQQAGETKTHTAATDSNGWTRWATVDHLRKTTEFWGPILLLVDDAQLLSVSVLNELRAFTEEEWKGRRLVRCLVAGPLTLEEELARPTHGDFSRRIRCHAFLQPLTSRESAEFLCRHLEAVGGKPVNVFSPEAIEFLVSACDGLPRCLSLLADESLIVTAELNRKTADIECVRQALSRLQHLPYAWNASLWPSDDMEADPVSDSEPTVSFVTEASPRVTSTSAAFEFGSPGIIEIGAPRSRDTVVATMPQQSVVSAVSTTPISMSMPASSDGRTPDVSFFEVGYRFEHQKQRDLPDAADSKAAAVDDTRMSYHVNGIANDAAVDLSSFVHLPGDSFAGTSDRSLIDAEPTMDLDEVSSTEELTSNTFSDDMEGDSSVRSMSRVQFLSKALQDEPSSESNQVDTMEKWFSSSDTGRFANRIPVFDRYTWIALGRDVPSGTFSVASASKMQQLNSGMMNESDITLAGETAESGSRSFDSIPVTRTSDYEIVSSLTRSSTVSDQGAFMLFKVTPAASAKFETNDDLDVSTVSAFDGAGLPTVVGVEHFNPAETAMVATAIEESNMAGQSGEEESVISDANRQLIREAIRLSLAQAIRGTNPSGTDPANTTLPQEVETILDSILHQQGQGAESIWQDGQLVFGQSKANEPAAVDDNDTDDAEVALSFEAARIARDENSQAAAESVSREARVETLFTLPVEVKSIEWDLRSEMLDLDEVFPLAESLAALRDEVTSFQQFGRSTDIAAGDHRPAESGPIDMLGPADSGPFLPSDSLVSRAKRRLEEADLTVEAQSMVKTSWLSTPYQVDEQVISTRRELSPQAEESVSGVTPAISAAPRFSQLFTRLQAIRRQTGEK